MKNLTSTQERFLNTVVKGTWKMNSQGLIDVQGNVIMNSPQDFQDLGLESLRDLLGIRFGKVSGNFNAQGNEFEDLSGFPQEVGGDLILSKGLSPRLRNLQGLPTRRVGGDFDVYGNTLVSLEGGPEIVDGDYFCDENRLRTLKGAAFEVGGSFDCSNNELQSLQGAPRRVGGDFDCSYNKIQTLKGGLKEVGGDLICSNNRLRSLQDAPSKIGGRILTDGNPLTESSSYLRSFKDFINERYN